MLTENQRQIELLKKEIKAEQKVIDSAEEQISILSEDLLERRLEERRLDSERMFPYGV